MEFKCHHCGECCRNVSAQINLSISDLARICQFLKCEVKEIIPKIGIIPFLSENDNFDYELGLNLPCQFRKDSRCTIYPARPLNCRMFPYFILNTDVINPDFFCLKSLYTLILVLSNCFIHLGTYPVAPGIFINESLVFHLSQSLNV